MREIKYRAWDNVANEMYYTGEEELIVFIFGSNGIVADEIILDDSEQGYHVEKLEHLQYMQYTGLKDKNGKEIYEGDIIYWEINNGVGIESYTAIVKWSENLVKEGWNQTYKWLVGYTGDYYRGSYDELSTPAAYNDALQIIGNIYENPELLEGIA